MATDKSFQPYPELSDDDFYQKIYTKYEFNKTKTSKDSINPVKNPIAKACDPTQFNLQSYQEFLRNYLSTSTSYNSLLGFWGVGVGKTCAAIQVTEGLKENVKKMGKKIYIIAKKQVRPNFWKELYNTDKEKSETIPGSKQCTGATYYISKLEEKDDERRYRRIKTSISEYYEFFGMQSFVNYVDFVIKKEYPTDRLGDFFSDSVFVIDEAHSLTGAAKSKTESKHKPEADKTKFIKAKKISERGILTVLKEIFENSVGTKLLLLTATPMKDNEKELVDLINLMLLNDKNPLYPVDEKKLFPSENDVDQKYLSQLIKGYVSYVRGENPVTFPSIIEPSPAMLDLVEPKLYKPKPIYNEGHGELIDVNEQIKHTNLIRCPMSNYQFSNYVNTVGKILSKSGKKLESIDLVGRQASNMIFPTSSNPTLGQHGNEGFMNAFEEYTDPTPPVATGKTKTGKILYKKKPMLYKYRDFNQGFLDLTKIGRYSSKFECYLKNVVRSKGVIYTYSDFDDVGAKLIALALEANGYVRYKHQTKKETHDLLYVDDKDRQYRCSQCGHFKTDTIHNSKNDNNHKFIQATYVLFTGDESKYSKEEVDIVNSDDNKDGQIIKIIVGTVVSGEGIDYKRIRQVHIINPWHNNTRLYQVIGRAARHCSHKDLPSNERNVTVFKYSTAPPQIYYKYIYQLSQLIKDGLVNSNISKTETENFVFTYHDLFTETSDEKLYRRIEHKDIFVKKIERVLKTNAVDCFLNKNINIFATDNPLSRDCDYMECNYTCAGGVEDLDDKKITINRDTYNLHFSEPQISRAQKIIYDIFKYNFVLDLSHIIKLVKQRQEDVEKDYIEEALSRILGHPPQRPALPMVDRFSRAGHLIFSNPYYIFQPDDLADSQAPLYYRTTPLTIKTRFLNLEAIKSETMANIPQLQKHVTETDTVKPTIEKQIDDLIAIGNQFKIEYKLDRLSPEIQQEIYENVMFMDQDPYPKEFETILINYFNRHEKLYFKIVANQNRYIGHKINVETRKYDENQHEWITVDETDDDIKKMQSTMKSIHSNKPIKPYSNLHGFVIYNSKNGEYVFKLVDQDKQAVKYTKTVVTKKGIKQGNVSKKTTITGSVCENFTKPELVKYANKLQINANMQVESKESLCYLIEIKLRELDEKDPNYRQFYKRTT